MAMNVARRWLCLLLVPAALAAAGEAPPLGKLEKQMAELVNRERAGHKLPPLAYRDKLAAVARAHCLDMKTHDFVAHESKRTGRPRDRVAKAGIPFRGVGENLATGAPTVETGQRWLMLSPKHRANILNPLFRHIGIGILRDDKGRLIITQLFCIPPPHYDVEALLKTIADGINKARAAKGLRRLVPDAQLAKRAHRHSLRAARLGKFQPLWLEDRLAADSRRWHVHQVAYFLTDNVAEVISCDVAHSKLHDHVGLGIVQSAPDSKARGALWVTLICAQKK